MKVVLVSPYDYGTPGGVTEHVSHLDGFLRRAGHQTTIVAPMAHGGHRALPANVAVAGTVVRVPTNGSVARITLSFGLSRTVGEVLRRIQPDVIHVHEPFMPLLPIVALRHSEAANVATFHAYSGNELGYRYGRFLLSRFFSKLAGRIAVSETARRFVARYFPAEFTVIPNGVDLVRFRTAEPLADLRDEKLNLLFVGRLEDRKGFRILLRAFARLRRRGRSLRLIVVGAYTPRQGGRYRRLVEAAGISDVVFAGYATPDILSRYYVSSDVVCAPSLGGESFGIVLLEAMAAGKPIVASRIPGYCEVIEGESEGILVPPANVESLCMALDRLAVDADLRRELGENGRVKAERFAWPVVANQIVKVYEQACRSGPGPVTDNSDEVCHDRLRVAPGKAQG